MTWRMAASLEKLREQVNESYPRRSRISDGGIGDTSHVNRSSDHNPWYGPGIVTARDFTHDPEGGFDAHAFAERLRLSRDPRIKYVISNGRIFSSVVQPWEWRTYAGENPHTKHIHLSVVADQSCDVVSPWSAVWAMTEQPKPEPKDDDMPTPDDLWNHRLVDPDRPNVDLSARALVWDTRRDVNSAMYLGRRNERHVVALTALVAADKGLTPEELTDIVEAGVRRVFADAGEPEPEAS